jgi:hypothetical protein
MTSLLLGPHNAEALDIHIDLGGPPALVLVPETPVYYAPAVPYNYFLYDGRYYVFSQGAWYASPSYGGPWGFIAVKKVPKPILSVPVDYYRAPPGHWKKHGPPPWAGQGKAHKKPKNKKND